VACFVACCHASFHAFLFSCCVVKLAKSMELREAPWVMWQLRFVVAVASIARLHRKSSNTETILKMCIVRRQSLLQSRHGMRLSWNLLVSQPVLKWTNASKTSAFREYLRYQRVFLDSFYTYLQAKIIFPHVCCTASTDILCKFYWRF